MKEAPRPPGDPPSYDRREFIRLVTGAVSAGLAAPILATCGSGPGDGPDGGPDGAGSGTEAGYGDDGGRDAGTERDASGEDASGEDAATDGDTDAGSTAGRYEGWGRVVLVRTSNRAVGVVEALRLLGAPLPSGRVALKANFNNALPTPASTHPDVLRALVPQLRAAGATVTMAERSGSADTHHVLEALRIEELAQELGFEIVILDDLGASEWERIRPASSHWAQGFPIARIFRRSDAVVQACCLKTHDFGGHFTLSLKNSVGMVARNIPGDTYDFMSELHRSPHQRRMIAEINVAYRPAFAILDGVEAFVTGGPDEGEIVRAEAVLASTDRVALDAVGVALLRLHGTTPEVSNGSIWSQEQIARAVELGLGASGPGEVELVTGDAASRTLADALRPLLEA